MIRQYIHIPQGCDVAHHTDILNLVNAIPSYEKVQTGKINESSNQQSNKKLATNKNMLVNNKLWGQGRRLRYLSKDTGK